MNIYVQQTIQIHCIKIGAVSNSSVFQIGTSGTIQPASYLFNTGGFIKAAPQAEKNGGAEFKQESTLVPLSIS
ncbi:spore germination protein GerPB [Bacillus sp. 2205SS5-2]|uniref:spore germination protein GerPB n=1 Tax=Bacillus sp. 2205SS5-2 TaxID=3109031 RepID=UPI003004FEE6